MKFTGERYVPGDGWPQIAYEHWHRYLFAAQFVAGRSVLDIACGEGYGSRLLAGTAAYVLGVDADAESVAHAAANYPAPNLQFRRGDVTRIPEAREHAFDVVVSFETIEHVGEAEQVAFLCEVKRLLKPGGMLLVSTPDKRNYSEKPGAKNPYHRREFYKAEFLRFLGEYFRTVRPLGQKVYSGSLIWPLSEAAPAAAALSEHQLVYADGGYRAAPDDRKEPWYIVAACTDGDALPAAATSVLIDTSDRVSSVPIEALQGREHEVAALRADLERWKAEAAREAERAKGEARRVEATACELQDRLAQHVATAARAQVAAERALTEARAEGASAAADARRLRAEVADLQARLAEARDAAGRLAEVRPALHRQTESLDLLLPRMEALLPRVDQLLQAPYRQMIRHVREAASALLAGATVLVASRGDDELLRFEGLRGWHFPQAADGVYAGHYPADDAEAVGHLEGLRAKGATHLLLPATAFWWLDHYDGFRQHLKRYRVVHRDAACVIYGLKEVLARPAAAGPAPSPNAATAPAASGGGATLPATYQDVVRQVHRAVRSTVPANGTVLVVSKGDDALLSLDGRRAWHFPRREDGVYAGYYPPDSAEAITHLEECRARGAEFFVLPNTAFWWLESYADFGRHLASRYQLAWRDDACIVYRLGGAAAAGPAAAERVCPAPPAAPPASPPAPAVATKRPEDCLHPNLVTIVVPVYNAFDEVRTCLKSLVAHGRHPHRVLLIDDRSTDARVWPLLQAYATAHDHVVAVRNDANLGFTGTVNRGCRLTGGDVILLNSDTEVTAGWLEKLSACAASAPNVGTVTALSNAAGAFSVPVNNQDNEIPPHLTADDMAALVERLSGWVRPAVPTGNGFCMYVTRRLLREIGLFDEARFPRGYGEENDFCRRAAKAGFVNLIDDRTFVRHKGTASFLGSKAEHLARGLETLRRLHPGYDALVQEWLRNDPLDTLRSAITEKLAAGGIDAGGIAAGGARPREGADSRPCILYVVHDGTGGTLHMVEDLIRASAEHARCLLLKTGTDRWTLHEHVGGALRSSRVYAFSEPWRVDGPPDAERLAVLHEVCRAFAVALVHVHHLIGSGAWLPHALKDLGLPVVFSFHDFYPLCPTIQLLDERGTFCGAKCTSGEGDCNLAANLFRGAAPRIKHGFVHEHRKRMAEALRRCDVFVAPSQSTKGILLDALPFLGEAEFHVIEHGRDLPSGDCSKGQSYPNATVNKHANGNGNETKNGAAKIAPTAPRPGERARVLLLGNLNRAKGTEVILKVMALDAQQGPRFEFHFLGMKEPGFEPEALGGIYHGAYDRDSLRDLVRRIRPSFAMVASVWPETYCYTLTESWAVGLPVFASDVGALRERISKHGGGWLADYTDPRRWYETMVAVLNDHKEYEKQAALVAAMRIEPVGAMAVHYHRLYDHMLTPTGAGGPDDCRRRGTRFRPGGRAAAVPGALTDRA